MLLFGLFFSLSSCQILVICQYSATFRMFPVGTTFQPANMIELIKVFDVSARMNCFSQCNQNALCRTAVYDGDSKQCRHFEGEVSTGTVIASNSSWSQVVGITFSPTQYTSYNQTSDHCQSNRYLVVSEISNRCSCPPNTFWNGSMCLNQLLTGSTCQSNDWCRQSMSISCDSISQQCFQNYSSTTSTSSTTTSITTTITTTTTSSFLINYNVTFPAPIVSSNAAAQMYGINLLINGDAETGPCDTNGTIMPPVSYNNSLNPYVTQSTPGPSNRGGCYFLGSYTSSRGIMSQTISLYPYSVSIDRANVSFTLSAWLGGYSNQDDAAQASIYFLDYQYYLLMSPTTIGPVLASDRSMVTLFLLRQTTAMVPVNTRYMTIIVTAIRTAGTSNDGYVDNISVILNTI